jgi:hypothetical protein
VSGFATWVCAALADSLTPLFVQQVLDASGETADGSNSPVSLQAGIVDVLRRGPWIL